MYRIGQSRDIHRLEKNRKLILGTIEIPHPYGLVGHSDADCLVHCIVEAIIGALGLGDLGTHFPDTDNKYLGISSSYFLLEVKKLLEKEKYEIVNIDSTILLEKPKLITYVPQMKENIARLLNISISQINIKATRGEKLGFVGEELGCEACCCVLIKKQKTIKLEYL